MMAATDQQDLLGLRKLILKDHTALQKWTHVTEHINSPTDVLRIKAKLKKGQFEEAVLEFLRVWWSMGLKIPDLVDVLQQYDLITLADAIINRLPKAKSGKWFNVGEEAWNFTGRRDKLQRLHEKLLQSRKIGSFLKYVICITGLGGVGKSALARRYAFHKRHHYDFNVFWINADCENSIRNSFRELLNQKFGTQVGDTVSIEEMAKSVYSRLKNQKSLFIFDNVSDANHIHRLRYDIDPNFDTTPRILMTSRRRDLVVGENNEIFLGELSRDEAVELIRETFKKPGPTSVACLVETLQALPLALQQAIAYIYDELRCHDGNSIEVYLEQFVNDPKKLLKDDRFQMYCQQRPKYPKTTWTTWESSFATIGHREAASVTQLLSSFSYLNPKKMPITFLRMMSSPFEMAKHVQDLVDLSMINRLHAVEAEAVEVHGLVQLWIRLELSDQEKSETMTRTVSQLRIFINDLNPANNNTEAQTQAKEILEFVLPFCQRMHGLDHALTKDILTLLAGIMSVN